MPHSRRNFAVEPGSWYIVLLMKGQSVAAVGIGEAESDVLVDEAGWEVELGRREVVCGLVVVGVLRK
jgi:hypothetical protein